MARFVHTTASLPSPPFPRAPPTRNLRRRRLRCRNQGINRTDRRRHLPRPHVPPSAPGGRQGRRLAVACENAAGWSAWRCSGVRGCGRRGRSALLMAARHTRRRDFQALRGPRLRWVDAAGGGGGFRLPASSTSARRSRAVTSVAEGTRPSAAAQLAACVETRQPAPRSAPAARRPPPDVAPETALSLVVARASVSAPILRAAQGEGFSRHATGYDGSRRCAHHRSPTTPRGFLTDAAYHTRRGLSFARRKATRVLWFHHRAMLHPCTRDAPMDGSPWPGRESAPTLLTHPTGDWPSKSESTCSSYAEQACCKSAVGWLHISDPLFPLFQPAATKHRSAGRTCCGIGVGLVRPMFSLVARCGWGVAGRVGALLLVHTGWSAAEAVRILLLAHHWR